MDMEELESRPAVVKPTNLAALSVAELEAYIQALRGEIAAAETAIKQKKAHASAASAIFKSV